MYPLLYEWTSCDCCQWQGIGKHKRGMTLGVTNLMATFTTIGYTLTNGLCWSNKLTLPKYSTYNTKYVLLEICNGQDGLWVLLRISCCIIWKESQQSKHLNHIGNDSALKLFLFWNNLFCNAETLYRIRQPHLNLCDGCDLQNWRINETNANQT
jgi:hypothetical protein